MLKLYNITIYLFLFALKIYALFSKKTKQFFDVRKNIFTEIKENNYSNKNIAWFHCASLGEYEQAKELIKKFKEAFKEYEIILTFFSASGFKNYKKNKNINYVFYLPVDTKANAENFIDIVKPKIAFFTKSELWLNYMNELSKQKTPLYHVSSTFEKNNMLIKYSWCRKILMKSAWFFVQEINSKKTLNANGITNVSVVGNTRIDTIIANNKMDIDNEKVISFTKNKPTIIFASVWPEDEKIYLKYINENNKYNYIIAPHELDYISEISSKLDVQLYSKYYKETNKKILLIDKIGILKNIYKYSKATYVGGGFSKGIHNILEVSSHGIPVLFGPKYHKFNEAHELIRLNGAKSISQHSSFNNHIKNLKNWFEKESTDIYFSKNLGATKKIIDYIKNKNL